jgi:hypothetical protein
MKYIDLTNMRFDKWLVLGASNPDFHYSNYFWICQCDCGTIREVDGRNLLKKGSKSCGCNRLAPINRICDDCGIKHYSGKWHVLYPDTRKNGSLCDNCYYKRWRRINTAKVKRVQKRYNKRHPKRWRKYKNSDAMRLWKLANADKLKESKKRWRDKNQTYSAEYKKMLRKTSIEFRIIERQRSRLYSALKGKQKAIHTKELFGCSLVALKQHIESQFQEGMTWENWGSGKYKWHIDHILPLSSFCLTDPKQLKLAFHYTNMQPLWEPDNLRKGSKIVVKGENR